MLMIPIALQPLKIKRPHCIENALVVCATNELHTLSEGLYDRGWVAAFESGIGFQSVQSNVAEDYLHYYSIMVEII